MKMRKFKSDKRLEKISAAANARQFSLSVVLENIHDEHNVSAIIRSCEAVGIPKVNLLYTIEKFPKISRISSASASKWVDTEKYSSVNECFGTLRKNGFIIYSSYLDPTAKSLYQLDLTKKTALVFGNEHRGISDEIKEYSDELFYIPMKGMVQSLNVSVAIAVSLFEALRQREKKGMYDKSEMTQNEIDQLIDKWCSK